MARKRGEPINVLVIGAGAIGCLVGGALSLSGHTVTLLGRAYLAEAVQRDGLRLSWPDQMPRTAQPEVIESLQAFSDWDVLDLVLVTVKSYATADAVVGLATHLRPGTPVLSLQNGVGNETVLAAVLPDATILAGSITIPVEVPEPGHIVVSKDKGGIGLTVDKMVAAPGVSAAQFRVAGFRVQTYANADSLKWSKLLMNQLCNAVCAILDLSPQAALAYPGIYDLELAALRETLTVMQQRHIPVVSLPGYPVPWLARALRTLPNVVLRPALRPVLIGGRGQKLPSLLLDLRQSRKQLEVDVLNGAVVRAAAALGTRVPANHLIADTLQQIAAGQIDWNRYRHRPEVLLAEFAA